MEVFILKELNGKKYLLPQRVSKTHVELYEVSEEAYKKMMIDINRIRKATQRNGECYCTKDKFWQCDGCCEDCPFYHKKAISLSDVAYKDDKGENDITYEEITPDTTFSNTPEGMLFNILVEELKDTLERIDPKAKLIFESLYIKVMTNEFDSLRKIAEELEIPWSTFHDKLTIVQEWSKKIFGKK